jgi:dihydrolipoamide dehydrogenase
MFDTIIIGGGPAGYLAAERLGHLKKKVLLIEEKMGGTCLNCGCIPTKTLLNSAKLYHHAKEAGKYGVKAEQISFDWASMQNWKNDVVTKLRSGIDVKMKSCAVEVAPGKGEIISGDQGIFKVRVVSPNGINEHEGRTILVCTGSVPAMPPIPGSKGNPAVLNSTGLLEIEKVPEKLAIIGGGVIGVEFAGLFSCLGTEVTVIEMMDEIVPFMDREQSPLLRRAMKGVNFNLGCRVERIEGGCVHYTTKEGDPETAQADVILMAAGRRPVLEGWGTAGVEISGKGVVVDDRMRTNIAGIWAAGDVTGMSLLAHSAYRMAEVAVTDIVNYLDGAGQTDRMRYDSVPWAVYGITEAAGVGMTEQEAVGKGIAIKKASVPMRVSGRFVAENTMFGHGAVKVIASEGRILGIHAVGAYASEFIWGGAALIEKGFLVDDVKKIIFPHPTVSELIREAVWLLE